MKENHSRTLQVAVIGLGRIAWKTHLPRLRDDVRFNLAAVVDPSRKRVAETRRKFQVPAGFLSSEEMYAALRPDLVVVASPTPFHHAQVIEAFGEGCDVFCDKPLAMDLAETDSIIAAMRSAGRKLLVYQPHRFSSEALTCRTILDSGKLGSIYMVRRSISAFVRRNDWQALKKNGGGMLNNYGAHFLDQLLHLLGGRLHRASCELRTIASAGDADDVVKALLTLENGVVVDLDINMAQSLPGQAWVVLGSRGTAVLDAAEGSSWRLKYFLPEDLPCLKVDRALAAAGRLYPAESIPWRIETLSPQPAETERFYDHVYEYFALGHPPVVRIEETREVMRSIELCRRSAPPPRRTPPARTPSLSHAYVPGSS